MNHELNVLCALCRFGLFLHIIEHNPSDLYDYSRLSAIRLMPPLSSEVVGSLLLGIEPIYVFILNSLMASGVNYVDAAFCVVRLRGQVINLIMNLSRR